MVRHTSSLEWGGWDGHNVTNENNNWKRQQINTAAHGYQNKKKKTIKKKEANMKANMNVNMKAKKQGSKAAESKEGEMKYRACCEYKCMME